MAQKKVSTSFCLLLLRPNPDYWFSQLQYKTGKTVSNFLQRFVLVLSGEVSDKEQVKDQYILFVRSESDLKQPSISQGAGERIAEHPLQITKGQGPGVEYC